MTYVTYHVIYKSVVPFRSFRLASHEIHNKYVKTLLKPYQHLNLVLHTVPVRILYKKKNQK